MIVIGIDPHRQTHTAAAGDGVSGQLLGELTLPASPEGAERLIGWVGRFGGDPLYAPEDCRHVSRSLESFLLARGERLVRVPPKLMAAERRSDRRRGKSDAIDALAVARAALREQLPSALPDPAAREIKLLLDHREDLVGERTRLETRLRWHLHELELGLEVPQAALSRPLWQRRLASRLAGLEQTTLVVIAREQLLRISELTGRARQLEPQRSSLRPAPLVASTATRRSPCTPASHHSTHQAAASSDTGSTAPATGSSTAPCTGSPSPRRAPTDPHATTSRASKPKARPDARHSAASNAT